MLENDTRELLKDITSIEEEEDEGRIGLKLYSTEQSPFSGNICIRLSDAKSNFKIWENIKI